jgi:hypothetical protein
LSAFVVHRVTAALTRVALAFPFPPCWQLQSSAADVAAPHRIPTSANGAMERIGLDVIDPPSMNAVLAYWKDRWQVKVEVLKLSLLSDSVLP